ncbi:UDP-Glycosyltransferase/glycogen phosphorylase [Rhizodiscina lignyota]|uniref:Sterol 3-beta-glucosyltransferase n=1 Tax=Rhizodiscina lignyota TaxID=1504668 RepID=A0A9P4IKF5_9PEZI|nr:UDP-Glycosyltransferase/glycogen phosphorylase [Rhizodiscina lignyota]
MASEERLRERLGRRLTKRKAGDKKVSMDIPEHFKDGDDADEDVTAPKGKNAAQYMHQSIFSMITAAGGGAQVNYQSRFDDDPSESEEDGDGDKQEHAGQHTRINDGAHEGSPSQLSSSTKRKIKLMRSLPRLTKMRRPKDQREPSTDPMSSSQILPPKKQWQQELDEEDDAAKGSSEAPILSRMLTARAELEEADPESPVHKSKGEVDVGTHSVTGTVGLAQRLKEIFDFDDPEEVITEYPCWLLQTVLLQGYMYITQKHVCFYAYLPKKETTVSKSGYLAKRGRPKHMFKRYWFQLRGDVLTYFTDSSQPYFPSGHIDLRYGISANLDHEKEKGKEPTCFTVVTDKRDYYFRADSVTSAKEWVRNLQKVIFRSHNDGDSVKISLPIDNIVDIENNKALDFADTIRIKVIDNNETYAVDDYLFSFFSFGQEAFNILEILVNDNEIHTRNAPHDSPAARASGSTRPQPSSTERGRSPYSPGRSPSPSSHDAQPQEEKSPMSSRPFESEESVVHSLAHDTESSAAIQSIDETNASASQMLEASTLFRAPTMHRVEGSASQSSLENNRRGSEDTARSDLHRSAIGSQSAIPTPYDSVHGYPSVQKRPVATASSYALKEIMRAGASPFQTASEVAEYVRKRSKHMSSLLATESMGYYEKVSGMWAGNRKHYGVAEALAPDDEVREADDDETTANLIERFRMHFGLSETEQLKATYFGWIHRVLPLYGKIYISNKHFCFRSLLPGTRFKVVLPLNQIENANKERGYRPRYSALVISIRGFEELFFDFSRREDRDDCVVNLLQCLEQARYMQDSGMLTQEEISEAQTAKTEHQLLQEARQDGHAEHDMKLPGNVAVHEVEPEAPPILFDDPRASIINFKPTESLRITCLTIGSRGDVQPYIALCKGLLAEGHKPRIATHAEFKGWIEKHGIEFKPVDGDPAELMRICVENGMFTYSFLKEASAKFRGWIDALLVTAWQACQGSDLLIESPSAMAGIHIAEALQIPYFRAFSMPWTRTRAYPHAFAVPEHKLGGYYNYMSYVMFDHVFWKAIAGQVNRWRKKELGLGSTNLDMMQPNKVPFLYSFSPSVVAPPLDYSDWIRVTGYWFLDEAGDWKPPKDLTDFIAKARRDKKKLVYIGFGSIVVEDPAALTRVVVSSVLKADVRCILSKGWSDRLGKKDSTKPEIELPPEIFQIKSAPHDWLFKQIDAAAHHGGAGTTGASLRAGIPTIIKPFFGDQFFFGSRVEDLGVGICLKKVNVSYFARALWEATHSERMLKKAELLGDQIRKEDGVGNAIQSIYRDMEYAKTLVKRRKQSYDGIADDSEETWTFIGDESDPELKRSIAEWEPPAQRKPHVDDVYGVHQQAQGVRKRDTGVTESSGVISGTESSGKTEASG